jgi:hypothetical protein
MILFVHLYNGMYLHTLTWEQGGFGDQIGEWVGRTSSFGVAGAWVLVVSNRKMRKLAEIN